MKKLILLPVIVSFFLIGCQPSALATEAATAQPQSTVEQCTDRGWADITNYLYQFDQTLIDADPKADIGILTDQLEKIIENIKEVEIDSCTENARGSLISGLDNHIQGVQLTASGDATSARVFMNYSLRWIVAARDELKYYGIDLNYPAK